MITAVFKPRVRLTAQFLEIFPKYRDISLFARVFSDEGVRALSSPVSPAFQ
jgi:hypothetical protein